MKEVKREEEHFGNITMYAIFSYILQEIQTIGPETGGRGGGGQAREQCIHSGTPSFKDTPEIRTPFLSPNTVLTYNSTPEMRTPL